MNTILNISVNEFEKIAKENSVIPLYTEFSCDFMTPVAFYSKVNNPYSFILESVECSERFGRYSFIGLDPKFSIIYKNNLTIIKDFDSVSEEKTGDPIEHLKSLVNKYKPINFENLSGYHGGGVGYLSYDIIAVIEKLKLENKDVLQVPDLFFIFPKIIIIFDHLKHTIKLVYNGFIDSIKNSKMIYSEACLKIANIKNLFNESVSLPLLNSLSNTKEPLFSSNMEEDYFHGIVKKAKEYIFKGDAIQVVLSQRFSMPFKGNNLNLYRALRMINPSPYMFLINFPEFNLIGASPEILVKEEKKKVIIRPIAGTRKRGKDEEEDNANEQDLLSDEKEMAEHVMLVDLARNDIGRVCEKGSIKPNELLSIERYSHVMHIVSNVKGTLKKDKDAFDLIRACFPAGTVSGAPKIRAMEIIEELENTKRGPYAGSVCYFDFGGNFDSCITIRTILLKDGISYIQAGAGIVHDSIPKNEYLETVNKAKASFKAVQIADVTDDPLSEINL